MYKSTVKLIWKCVLIVDCFLQYLLLDCFMQYLLYCGLLWTQYLFMKNSREITCFNIFIFYTLSKNSTWLKKLYETESSWVLTRTNSWSERFHLSPSRYSHLAAPVTGVCWMVVQTPFVEVWEGRRLTL